MTNSNVPMANLSGPSNETIERKLGNTIYTITTICEGTESLFAKIKRLIFDDPAFIRTLLSRAM